MVTVVPLSAAEDHNLTDVQLHAFLGIITNFILEDNANISIEDKIVQRHNYYRNLEFQDSNLTWDSILANHAQQWADYLVANYTSTDRTNGVSPHASHFDTDTHGLPYIGEGENIAWSSNGRGYLTPEPVDITVAGTGDGGSIDAWANEKANYDYTSNNTTNGEAIGHYTQIVWQKTTKVGCGKASGSDGEYVVCRYTVQGNYNRQKPYCSNYTLSDLYTHDSLVFTDTMIHDSSFTITKILEDRNACTRTDKPDSTLNINGTSTAVIPQYNAFNKADDSNLWDMDFDDISIDTLGQLIMTNTENDRYMKLKLIGETATYYSAEAYWWVRNTSYNRSAVLKLLK